MQHRWNAAESCGKDGGSSDVAAGAKHQLDAFPPDQTGHADPCGQQSQQLDGLAQPAALQSPCIHSEQAVARWNQLCFEAGWDPQPAHLPILRECFCHC